MPRKIVALQVRLPDDLHAEIKQMTENEDRPLNRTIIRLLRAGLEHYRLMPTEIDNPQDLNTLRRKSGLNQVEETSE